MSVIRVKYQQDSKKIASRHNPSHFACAKLFKFGR